MKIDISTPCFIFFVLLASMVSAAQLEISEDEVYRQEAAFSSKVSFGEAFGSAVSSFFINSDDSESFVAFVAENYPDAAQREAELSRILDDKETIFKILTASDPVAPHGENISENWIFTLQTSKSDHIFYAVVNRQDPLLSYNYGFN